MNGYILMATQEFLTIEGARQNNLKGFNLQIPLNKMTVITGVSGSGKSSLAFDTIYAEGQRRYIETFSSYARQFLDRMDRPAVDKIDNLPPAIAVDQTNPVRTSRSTVGTMTEINDHLKLLFARTATLTCGNCKKTVQRDTAQSVLDSLRSLPLKTLLQITFTVNIPEQFSKKEIVSILNTQGYTRFFKESDNQIEVLLDRVSYDNQNFERIIEDCENAFRHGNGKLSIHYNTSDSSAMTLRFSSGLHCPDCDINYRDPSPGMFSFNSPVGACESCRGFGRIIGVDYDLVIPDKSKSLSSGAIKPWQTDSYRECHDDCIRFAKKKGIPIDVPWNKLSEHHKKWVLEGEGAWDDGVWYGVDRFFKWLESRSYKMHVRVLLSRYRAYHLCDSCKGARLKPESLLWKIGSEKINIQQIMMMPVSQCLDFFNKLTLPSPLDEAAELVLSQIRTRLTYLTDVGLGYLTLDRQSRTLSGGEVQRINLTTALGTSLVNTCFVLDEPSIGLHSRDINRLIGVLHKLRDAGNTLIIVEHDPEVIRASDHIIDMGPGPGDHGGEIVFSGSQSALFQSEKSITARYLNKGCSIQPPKKVQNKSHLHIKGAQENNLKNIDINIPLGMLVCLTGVSGSGKSTLLQEIIYKGVQRYKGIAGEAPGLFSSIKGYESISEIVLVDQSPIGKTTRSNPVSYVGAFDPIRTLFASQPESRKRGYTTGTFSFNSGDGRCPTCQGTGFEHVEMQFLSDVYLRCPDCNGKRFRDEILEIKVNNQSIFDILEMTVDTASEFFLDFPKIIKCINPLKAVGLGYMRLGQPLPTLSGGEAQRLKLAGHLAESTTKGQSNLFLFDEPTTGLHFSDIEVLMEAFHALIDKGHSVIIIEHNLDVISRADWLIDLGPEGGTSGGEIVFTGTPSDLVSCKESYTAKALVNYSKPVKNSVISSTKESAATIYTNDTIDIVNAREHNLKSVSISVPRNQITVITGVSGSGKSTLAFDILFEEGRRRYLESLNAYARQFVQPASRPDVDSITGLPPSVAIEQRTSRGGRKSTVATITEIYHYLRLLFGKLGVQYCPDCSIPITPQTSESIVATVMKQYKRTTVSILAPLVINRKGIYKDLAQWVASKGYQHLRVDGKIVPVNPWPSIDRFKEHTIELPVTELLISATQEQLLKEAITTALEFGKGVLYIKNVKTKDPAVVYSTLRACPQCSRSFEEPDPRLFSFNSKHGWCPNCFGTGIELQGFDASQSGEEIQWNDWWDGTEHSCHVCNGKRLRTEALNIRLNDKSISDVTSLSVRDALSFFNGTQFKGRSAEIGDTIISECMSRLSFLDKVGLGYISLDRAAPTLSGGEAQRIRLAAQLGSNLRGVCYILDEPTIGLHSRDNDQLLKTLRALSEKKNTVVIVEHDEDTIRQADFIIDLGVGGGTTGGQVIASGTQKQILKSKESLTARYLKQPLLHNRTRRPIDTAQQITIKKATLHNLKSIDISIPLGRLVCVTGVSGSGKSTLIRDILFNNVAAVLQKSDKSFKFNGCKSIENWESITRILEVDQRPIGKTSRSCPATYTGIMDPIRKIFAALPESSIRGYGASRFSFNVDEGRCPECEGQGVKKIEMNFLPDVTVLCDACGGARFTQETCAVRFKDKSISDVLSMNIDDSVEFFNAHRSILKVLKLLKETGLGYLSLGQPSPALSGGEAQRIKLVTELSKSVVESGKYNKIGKQSHTMFILDEPTVGLHMADVDKLIQILHQLVDTGNSVVIIEHNLDLIAESDWIIDLGPEGGIDGGVVVAEGTPEMLIKLGKTHTSRFLKAMFETRKLLK